jgi:hypothetical protein
VGEGGTDAQSAFVTGEGVCLRGKNPSSVADFVRATFSHKGRRKEGKKAVGWVEHPAG